MTTKESRARFIDTLYEMRQDGELSDNDLQSLLSHRSISRWTYDLIRRLPIK